MLHCYQRRQNPSLLSVLFLLHVTIVMWGVLQSRVEVFEISDAFVDHPAQRFNVAIMRHLDEDRQVERGLRAVRVSPSWMTCIGRIGCM